VLESLLLSLQGLLLLLTQELLLMLCAVYVAREDVMSFSVEISKYQMVYLFPTTSFLFNII
jgi:hypothetical protein